MPSPFPGMDPYLEGDLWTSFHALFATQIVRELNRNLGPEYVAQAHGLSPPRVRKRFEDMTFAGMVQYSGALRQALAKGALRQGLAQRFFGCKVLCFNGLGRGKPALRQIL